MVYSLSGHQAKKTYNTLQKISTNSILPSKWLSLSLKPLSWMSKYIWKTIQSTQTSMSNQPTPTNTYTETAATLLIYKLAISFGLETHLQRICSKEETYKQRTDELIHHLLRRGYKEHRVQSKINSTSITTRNDCLKTRIKKQQVANLWYTSSSPSYMSILWLYENNHPLPSHYHIQKTNKPRRHPSPSRNQHPPPP